TASHTRSSACRCSLQGRGSCSPVKSMPMSEVILAPGLWMPTMAMGLLAARLARRGYRTRTFRYFGRSSFEANLERFARHAKQMLGVRPAHFVGHSLGGVLVLDMLNRHEEVGVRSAVLL